MYQQNILQLNFANKNIEKCLVKRLTADVLLRVWRKSNLILRADAAKVKDER